MEKLTGLLAFLVTLSLATERITEVVKGFPLVTKWFAVEKPDPDFEAWRKASVQFLAIFVGTVLAMQVPDAVAAAVGTAKPEGWSFLYLLFGALASGGSGLWNALLDITREVKKQRELLTKTQGG